MNDYNTDGDSKFSSNRPGIRSWIFFFLGSTLCVGIFIAVSPQHRFEDVFSFSKGDVGKEEIRERGPKKRNRKKVKKHKKRRGKKTKENEEDYVFNDIEFGEVGRESDERDIASKKELPPLPPPPKTLWDPSPNYRPLAKYREKNTTTSITTTVDFDGKTKNAKGISASIIRKKMNGKSVRTCYAQAVQRAPKMRGRVDLEGTIEKDGHVSYIHVTRSQLRSRDVEKCMVSKWRKIRFPRAGRATKFSTHLTFSSR